MKNSFKLLILGSSLSFLAACNTTTPSLNNEPSYITNNSPLATRFTSGEELINTIKGKNLHEKAEKKISRPTLEYQYSPKAGLIVLKDGKRLKGKNENLDQKPKEKASEGIHEIGAAIDRHPGDLDRYFKELIKRHRERGTLKEAINHRDGNNYTPLMRLLISRHISTKNKKRFIKKLLQNGAEEFLFVKNNSGDTAYDIAAKKLRDSRRKKEIIKLLEIPERPFAVEEQAVKATKKPSLWARLLSFFRVRT